MQRAIRGLRGGKELDQDMVAPGTDLAATKRPHKPDKPKKPKKKAKRHKPQEVRGPRGAYILFNIDKRASIVAEHPGHLHLVRLADSFTGVPVTEISKLIGAAWRTATSEERELYHKRASEDKERYRRELEEHGKQPTDVEDDESAASGAESSDE